MKYLRLVLVIVFNALWISYIEPVHNFFLIVEILVCSTLAFGITFAISSKKSKNRIFIWALFYGSLLSLILFLVLSFLAFVALLITVYYFLEILSSFFDKLDALGKML
ncbi:hypothetical protein [Bernardetia sp. MNP-M8]|uniref:hypothetical protein n=1 Tax=Bernardetia sp. MNP-M8 TaxID=3127470 RepID=UPI0030CACC00